MSNFEDERDRVKITHYINPHMFWFKYEVDFLTNELFVWENKLQSHFFKLLKSPATAYHPQRGEIVAVFIFSFNRWIRAVCDFISSQNNVKKYYVWAIDYGMPFQVEDRWIRQMPSELEEGPRETICFAGIMNVIPAQKTYNLSKLEAEMIPCEKWSQGAIATIEKLIKEASEIRFIRNRKSKDGQFFGNLIFTSANKKMVMADMILQQIDQAKTVQPMDFFKALEMIGSNGLARWLSSTDDTPQALKSSSGESDGHKCVEGVGIADVVPESSYSEMDVARKFKDWEKRNEIYRLQDDISIGDVSFNDSVSVRQLPKNSGLHKTEPIVESDEDNDDPPVIMKAGVLRRLCLSKYQHSIPLPPDENYKSDDNVAFTDKEQCSLNIREKDEASDSAGTLVTSKTKNGINGTDQGAKDPGISNAVQLLINHRANIRKSFLSKVQSTANDKADIKPALEMSNDEESKSSKEMDEISEQPKQYKQANSISPQNSVTNRKSGSTASAERKFTSLSPTSPEISVENEIRNRYKNKIQDKNVIPAGFDLRNLSQKPKSFHHSSGIDTESSDKKSENSKIIEGIHQKIERPSPTWIPKNDVTSRPENFERTGSKLKFRGSTYNDANKVCLNNLDEMCLQTHLSKHLVLVHGKHIAKPIDNLKSANFCDEVHQELELMRLNQIYRLQSYTWPHLMRGNSSVVVNSSRTGRTLSYLPAICSLIKAESDEGLVPDTVGPIGIIVAPSSVEVERISKMCRRFLQGAPTKIGIVESFGVRNMQKTTRYLLNGCEVLVSTPPSLSRLIKNKLKLFDTKRIKHLIFDDIDFMQEETKSELHEILKFCCGSKSTTSVQMVVIAKYWSPILSGFLKMAHNTQLCIGAYIEAAVYARSLFKLKIIKKTSKTHELLQFIKAHPYSTERMIIVCNKSEELSEVVEALKSNSCFYVACSGDSTADEIDLTKIWHQQSKGEMSVLVCTDDILPEIKVNQAQNIIHYSLPQSWTRFSFRFSTLFGYFHDFVKSSVPVKTPPSCLILLDENNNTQLPKLIHFLKSHQVEDIAEEIYTVCNRIKVQREEERITENRQFCPYVMEFGKCFNIEDCPCRHELTKYDKPHDNLVVQGNILFKVLEVISPTHYTVRLLEHQIGPQKPWKKIAGSNNYLKFNLNFAQYFSNTNNHQLHWPVEVGDLCVASEGQTFHRAKVLHVGKSRSLTLSTDTTCRVKLVDTGRVIACKSSHLLFLPEEFRVLPHQAVELRISGIIPYDHEQDWSSNATDIVEYWFKKYITDKVNVIAKIKFGLMDTIWVDNIKIIENLKSIQTYVTVVNIKKSLLEKQFGTICHDVEQLLREKAAACGIFKDESMESSEDHTEDTKSCSDNSNLAYNHINKSQRSNTPSSDDLRQKNSRNQTEMLQKNVLDVHIKESWEKLLEKKFYRVSVGAFYNPNLFYIQHLNDLKSNEKLYKAIDDHMLNRPEVVSEPIIGLNCLAMYEEKYNRAKITKVVCDGGSQELIVTLFFCDIGMSSTLKLSGVYHSTKNIVEMLPFQAIRCRMVGIVPNKYGVWTDDVCDSIYDNILDHAQFLYARAVKAEHPRSELILKYWRYEVILLDCTTEIDVNINKHIVEIGLGSYDSETNALLKPENGNISDSSDEHSSESNWDDCNYVSPKTIDFNPNFGLEGLDVDVDIQFTQDDILQLLNLPSTAKILPPELPKREINSMTTIKEEKDQINPVDNFEQNKISKNLKATKQKISNCVKSENLRCFGSHYNLHESIPPLKKLFKIPQVIWQQSNSIVSIQITAPDIEDYYLRVSSTALIFIAKVQDELRYLLLNFYGCVDPSLVSHEVRGLKAVIRLPKALKGFIWPRLLYEGDKNGWLKYNYDSIIIEQEALVNTGRTRRQSSFVDSSSDETHTDDDENDNYENDLFDPFDD